MKKIHYISLLVGLVGVAVGAAIVRAAPSDETNGRTITYTGYLEEGGAALDDTRSMTFELQRENGDVLWPSVGGDATADVDVVAGRFSVELGGDEMDGLPDEVFELGEVFLNVSVGGTALAGRQRLGTSRRAEYAARANRAGGAEGSLETRLAALEAQTASVAGTYCGSSAVTTGAAGGYAGLAAMCSAVCAGGAHPCSATEAVLSAAAGTPIDQAAWIVTGNMSRDSGDGFSQRVRSDCRSFTDGTTNQLGTIWNPGLDSSADHSGCQSSRPVACCR